MALDQFNTFTPIPVIPDLRFGFDPPALRKALVWPDRPERFDPSMEGLRRLEVASYLYDAQGQLHRLRRMRARKPPMDAAALQASVDAAERYILSAQGEDGRFEYKADPFTGRVTYRGFALARQAGTTLVICELARDDARAEVVARKALEMLVSTMVTHDDWGVLIPPTTKDPKRGGLGATALSTIALLSCRDRVGDQFDDAIARLTRFLLRLRREDGSFHPEIDLATGEPILGPDPLYAVGQAVFALTLLERLLIEEDLPDMPPLDLTRETVEAAMNYTAGGYWDNFAANFFWMEENWHCLAARASLGHHRNDAYERFCIDYSQYKTRLILSEEDEVEPDLVGGYGFGNVLLPHNTGSSGFGEAMGAALALKKARGEDTTADEEVLRRALQFLVLHQWDETGCFACATEPHSMLGGVLRAHGVARDPHRLRPARDGGHGSRGPHARSGRGLVHPRAGDPSVNTTMGPLRRLAVAIWSVGLLVALLVPILRDPPRDGFPLSNYPMFSHPKERGNARIVHVVAYSREGRHRPVPPDLLGSEEIMQAYQTVQVAIRRGHTAELCEHTAARLAEDPEHADIESLEVRTDVYDAVSYFAGDKKPRGTQVHARCSVASGEAGS